MKTKGNILIIAIVAAAVLMLAGLIVFYTVSKKQGGYPESSQTQVDEQVSALEKQSSSDKASDINKDLNNTNLDNIDNGVDQAVSEASGL